jgi:uncharacterized membrane protein YjfL (UPF0719 family)
MEFSNLAFNILYAILGLGLMMIAYRVFDWLTPKVDFNEELKNGNVAVALFIASVFISIALIIGKSLQ